MLPSQFPDWKKIGWHFGKKLKDILSPSPGEAGPSKAERKAQRLRDIPRGFAYLDDFDELNSWVTSDVDPVQQANTPLLARSTDSIQDSSSEKSKVLLCHDYNGGYHDYEAVRPDKMSSELYSCHYLQYVDTFVYFSHKLVCVPPPTWTNTLHRNGVKVLGTCIVEPQTPDIEKMLVTANGSFHIAEQLARMADAYGFDGWLLNIEKEFSTNVTKQLLDFIKCLKQALGDCRQVIWYDALDTDNYVDHQNELTMKNIEFARAAGALFTNYKWTEVNLQSSETLARKYDMDMREIYFGIDVWAQNTNMPGPPRVTFPSEGGGGTNTGFAIAKLAQWGFSTAIFGPAWTYQHFAGGRLLKDGRSISKAVDQSLWEGATLPNKLYCDCQKGRPHHTDFYQLNPVVRHACQYSAGSSEFFDSTFKDAFEYDTEDKDRRLLSVLGSQDTFPKLLPMSLSLWEETKKGLPKRVLYGTVTVEGAFSLTVNTRMIGIHASQSKDSLSATQEMPIQSQPMYRLCLYRVNMPGDGSRRLTVKYSRERPSRAATVGVYVAFGSSSKEDIRYKDYEVHYEDEEKHVLAVDLQSDLPGTRATEIGVYCQGTFERDSSLPLLKIARITIKPILAAKPVSGFSIRNVRMTQRGAPPNVQKRVAWEWNGSRDAWPTGLPWSKTTGPFSHFTISTPTTKLGDAHCLEFPFLEGDLSGDDKDIEHRFQVIGSLFGGGLVTCSTPEALRHR